MDGAIQFLIALIKSVLVDVPRPIFTVACRANIRRNDHSSFVDVHLTSVGVMVVLLA